LVVLNCCWAKLLIVNTIAAKIVKIAFMLISSFTC
jgi:hypothetical protein